MQRQMNAWQAVYDEIRRLEEEEEERRREEEERRLRGNDAYFDEDGRYVIQLFPEGQSEEESRRLKCYIVHLLKWKNDEDKIDKSGKRQ